MNEHVAHAIPPRTHRGPATTKSASHSSSSSHRAGHEIGLHPEDRPYVTDEAGRRPVRQTQAASRPAPRPADGDEGQDEDAVYNTRAPSSVRRYAPAAPQPPVSMRVQYHADQRVRPAGILARSSSRSTPAPRPRVQAEEQEEETRPQPRRTRLSTLLLMLGVLILVMLVGWTLLTVLLSW